MNKIVFKINENVHNLSISLIIDAEIYLKYENCSIVKEGTNIFKLYNNKKSDYSIILPNGYRRFRMLIGDYSASRIGIKRFTIFKPNNFKYVNETGKYIITQNINFNDRTKEEVFEYIEDVKAALYLLSKHYKSQINDIHTIR